MPAIDPQVNGEPNRMKYLTISITVGRENRGADVEQAESLMRQIAEVSAWQAAWPKAGTSNSQKTPSLGVALAAICIEI